MKRLRAEGGEMSEAKVLTGMEGTRTFLGQWQKKKWKLDMQLINFSGRTDRDL